MLASIAVIVAALYVAKGVLVPITLAVLLSFLLSPVCDWLERHWLGRVPAVMVTALVGFTVFAGATWMAAVQVSDLAPRMPEYETNLKAKLQSANTYVSATLGRVTRTAQGMSENLSPVELAQRAAGDQGMALLRSGSFRRRRARCRSLAACLAPCFRCWARSVW